MQKKHKWLTDKTLAAVKNFAVFFDLMSSGPKTEVAQRIVDFLFSPSALKRTKVSTPRKSPKSKAKKTTPKTKKTKAKAKGDDSVKEADLSDEDDEQDESASETDTPKKRAGDKEGQTGPKAKRAKTETKALESDSDSSDSDDEDNMQHEVIKSVIKAFLKTADLDAVKMTDVREHLKTKIADLEITKPLKAVIKEMTIKLVTKLKEDA